MSGATERGRFAWYDLMTTDQDAAIDFYTKLIGWETRPFEGGEQPYTMWANGDQPLGGLMDISPEAVAAGAPPSWMAYVVVPDVAAAAEQVVELGGSVTHPPTDIPNVGQFAVIADPQGAAIAIYGSHNDGSAPEEPPTVGRFSWHELMTVDYLGGFEFYHALFGWEVLEDMDMGEHGVYRIYGRNGVPLGGMMNTTEDMSMPPSWVYYIRVEDVDKAAADVKELGGQVTVGPIEVPGGDRIVQCTDPQGGYFALHSSAS